MIQNGQQVGTRAAGELLRSLLLQRPYQDSWKPFQRRELPPGTVSQAAVAQVVALHLWDSGQRPESELSLPRLLKDRIHRALNGEVLSQETLGWLVGAFDMPDDHARRLHEVRFADARLGLPVVDTLQGPQFLPVPQRHRTIAVFERRFIGPLQRAVRHQTVSAITACENDVDSYPYRLVRGASHVVVRRGGYLARRLEFAGGSPVLEIALSTPLSLGQVASLEYDVEFFADLGVTTEYRRVAHARADNVDIVVQFDWERMPRQVWWTVWDDFHGGQILSQEPVIPDREGCVHRFLPYLENAAAGFRWSW
jgi:hypothetical protein